MQIQPISFHLSKNLTDRRSCLQVPPIAAVPCTNTLADMYSTWRRICWCSVQMWVKEVEEHKQNLSIWASKHTWRAHGQQTRGLLHPDLLQELKQFMATDVCVCVIETTVKKQRDSHQSFESDVEALLQKYQLGSEIQSMCVCVFVWDREVNEWQDICNTCVVAFSTDRWVLFIKVVKIKKGIKGLHIKAYSVHRFKMFSLGHPRHSPSSQSDKLFRQ